MHKVQVALIAGIELLNVIHVLSFYSFLEYLFWATVQFPTSYIMHNMDK